MWLARLVNFNCGTLVEKLIKSYYTWGRIAADLPTCGFRQPGQQPVGIQTSGIPLSTSLPYCRSPNGFV